MNLRTIFIGVVIAGASGTAAIAQQPPGSYRQSCSNIRFDGRQLSAICADGVGRRVPTSLFVDRCIGGISNQNGQLYCQAGGPPQNYGRRYEEDEDDYRPRRRPPPPPQYGGDYGRPQGRLPGGSWRASCTNVEMRGPIVNAACADARGNYRPTSADMRECPSFSNRNGSLVCD